MTKCTLCNDDDGFSPPNHEYVSVPPVRNCPSCAEEFQDQLKIFFEKYHSKYHCLIRDALAFYFRRLKKHGVDVNEYMDELISFAIYPKDI